MTVLTRTRRTNEELNFDILRDPRVVEAARRVAAKRAELDALADNPEHAARRAALVASRSAIEIKIELNEATGADLAALTVALRQLDDAERLAADRAASIRLAVAELERRERDVESAVSRELRPQVERALRAGAEELAPVLRQAAEINRRLLAVARQASGWMNVPIHGLPDLLLDEDPRGDIYTKSDGGGSALSMWFRACRDAGYDV